ncbi:R2-like ligand-binding oxidase [Amycolatopsis sp. NPDC021455]|uniref:R2-like ligand-binding oxidase n=1 Tax=Amycolatopsis sp. NPDC021455 TaxID=3154901 RepID=UPI00340D9640
MTTRTGFQVLTERRLDWDSLPLRLLAKGNRKFWNPADLDFAQDASDWTRLPESYRRALTFQVAMFVAGEEAVATDIQPFARAISAEGRLGDSLYLTQFAFEEARHTEVFCRWLNAVGLTEDLHGYVAGNPGYREIFYRRLPAALHALDDDPSPANQVVASVIYNHIVEGTLALTGYFSFGVFCRSLGILPGMAELIRLIGEDERRHMAWGTHTCRRHVAADRANWAIAERTFAELRPAAMSALDWVFDQMNDTPFRFGRRVTKQFARGRVERRLRAIEGAVRGNDAPEDASPFSPEDLEDRFAEDDAEAANRAERLLGAAAGLPSRTRDGR